MMNNNLKIESPCFLYVMMSRIVLIENQELEALRKGRISENTRKATQFAVNLYMIHGEKSTPVWGIDMPRWTVAFLQ